MKNYSPRLKKLENQTRTDEEDEYFFFLGFGEWTDEEKREAIRTYPDCNWFWKLLSTALPYNEVCRRKALGLPLDRPASNLIADKMLLPMNDRMMKLAEMAPKDPERNDHC